MGHRARGTSLTPIADANRGSAPYALVNLPGYCFPFEPSDVNHLAGLLEAAAPDEEYIPPSRTSYQQSANAVFLREREGEGRGRTSSRSNPPG